MSGQRDRIRRLEKKVTELPRNSTPQAAWAAILAGNGNPGHFARACQPHLAELQSKMLGHGRRAMEDPAVVSTPRYFGLALRPLMLLAEIVAIPPEEPVPEQLLRWRHRPLYNPEAWQRQGARFGPDHIFGYRRRYTDWCNAEMAWLVSPELEANRLRQQLHTGTLPDLPIPVDPGAMLTDRPAGLFTLLERCCQR